MEVVTGFASNVLSDLWNKVVQVGKMVISLPQYFADMEAQAQEKNPAQRIVKTSLDKLNRTIKIMMIYLRAPTTHLFP